MDVSELKTMKKRLAEDLELRIKLFQEETGTVPDVRIELIPHMTIGSRELSHTIIRVHVDVTL